MKLFLVCMIRNEIDILPAFLSHIDSLFDSGCFIYHLSSDGSQHLLRAFASTHREWEYRSLRTPAYVQAEISTEMLHRGFERDADAVFFLDADEFIGSMNRDALEQSVDFLETNKLAGQLRWRNCLPAEYGDSFLLDRPAWHCGLSPHKKLVVPTWLYRSYGSVLRMNQGNHSVRLPAGATLRTAPLAELLHFPIRSRSQFVRKIIVSYVSQAMKPGKAVAPHICALFDTVTRSDLSPELLNALAVDYGSQTAINQPLAYAEMEQRGYKFGLPDISCNQLDLIPLPASSKVIDFGDLVNDEQEDLERRSA